MSNLSQIQEWKEPLNSCNGGKNEEDESGETSSNSNLKLEKEETNDESPETEIFKFLPVKNY